MRKGVSVILALAVTANPALAGVTGRPSRQTLIVRSYDNYGVSPAKLDAAETDVRRIFARTGIAIIWVDCGDTSNGRCAQPLAINELVIRFVRASATGEHGRFTMGYALVDEHAVAGALLTIYPDLVSRIADEAAADRPLLGRVIAHEMGHLLLGSTHSRHGLMRPVWTPTDVARDFSLDWVFSTGEANRMREWLANPPRLQDRR